MGAAQRAIAHGRGEYERLAGEPVEVRGMHGVAPERDVLAKAVLAPETHRVVTELIGEDVYDVREGSGLLFPDMASGGR